jgi:hypothetical protein
MSQVGQTQAQISQLQASGRDELSGQSLDAKAAPAAASEMFADPSTASSAAANSSAQRVLALLG